VDEKCMDYKAECVRCARRPQETLRDVVSKDGWTRQLHMEHAIDY